MVRPEEWPSLRATRLAALDDAPTAYASTLPDVLAHPDEVWIRRATPSDDEASLAAIDAGTWVGMCAVLVDRIANRAQLVAMWVDPGHRRRGIGVGLIAAATAWCRSRGVATIHLWVNEANAAAIALYRHAGFEPSGERIPFESHTGHFEVSMSRSMDESR